MDNITISLNGKLSQVCKQLNAYGISLNEQETRQLLDAIIANKEILQPDETATSKMNLPNLPTGCIGFMTMDYSYHISIKKLSLCAISFIANKLSKGISDKVLGAFGVSFKAISAIEELNGEKCIIKETILFHDKLGNVDILDKFKGVCCNHDLNCAHREDGKCKCTKEKIANIYDSLTERGVFKKVGSDYKLNW